MTPVVSLHDPEEAGFAPERTPRVLHLPKLDPSGIVNSESNYDHGVSQWTKHIPLVAPIVSKSPILAQLGHENPLCVELEMLGDLDGCHDGVAVQQDVLEVPLGVLVPGSHHAAQDD